MPRLFLCVILAVQCTVLYYTVQCTVYCTVLYCKQRLLYVEVPIVKGRGENTNNNIIIIFIQEKEL